MTSRQRVLKAVNHEIPDRVPIDLGGFQTGIHVSAYAALRKKVASIGAAIIVAASLYALAQDQTCGSQQTAQLSVMSFNVRVDGGFVSYTITEDVGWLSVDPTGGHAWGEPDTITIMYDTASLSAGLYAATITIDAPAATNTPQEITVCLTVSIPGDLDEDGDVDQVDFGRFQACFTGAGIPQNGFACIAARLDDDTDVDKNDLAVFQACMSGPNIPADPLCAVQVLFPVSSASSPGH